MKTEENTTRAIVEKLKKDGKLVYLNQKEHIEAIETMNAHLEQVRREYKVKERNSIESSARAILTSC